MMEHPDITRVREKGAVLTAFSVVYRKTREYWVSQSAPDFILRAYGPPLEALPSFVRLITDNETGTKKPRIPVELPYSVAVPLNTFHAKCREAGRNLFVMFMSSPAMQPYKDRIEENWRKGRSGSIETLEYIFVKMSGVELVLHEKDGDKTHSITLNNDTFIGTRMHPLAQVLYAMRAGIQQLDLGERTDFLKESIGFDEKIVKTIADFYSEVLPNLPVLKEESFLITKSLVLTTPQLKKL